MTTDDTPTTLEPQVGQQRRVTRPATKNRAFQGAFDKGQKARVAGDSIMDCPYGDHTNSRGRNTFSRAFRRYWREGWRSLDV